MQVTIKDKKFELMRSRRTKARVR